MTSHAAHFEGLAKCMCEVSLGKRKMLEPTTWVCISTVSVRLSREAGVGRGE